MKTHNNRKYLSISFACAIFFSSCIQAQILDQIIAIVEEDVVLESELARETAMIAARIKASQNLMPPELLLRKQVLERLVIQKLQQQLAMRSGIEINDNILQSAVMDIARNNNMSYEQFRAELTSKGMDYQAFAANIRNEIIVNQLRAREIGSRVQVTDREIEHYLETQAHLGGNNASYHLGHILISVPETASASVIQTATTKAQNLITKLRAGKNFKQLAIQMSDDDKALTGGDLGWRTLGQVPTVLVEAVSNMQANDISEPIRSPSGFHIVKVIEVSGGLDLDTEHVITKTQARHILIKTNALINDAEAESRLLGLRKRIQDGDDFANLARSNSDDKGSALKGGDLGWVKPGVLVPKFEQTMQSLAINEISQPIQTQFGWHIIQVLDKKQLNDSSEHQKDQVKEEIKRRKIEEETELWLRRLRDEAFVTINLERL